MNRQDYMSRQESGSRKANGQFTKQALANMADKVRERIMNLKSAWYTSPAWYGMRLANTPRHAHAKGKRVLHVNNF